MLTMMNLRMPLYEQCLASCVDQNEVVLLAIGSMIYR